jgi:hypothetical protein
MDAGTFVTNGAGLARWTGRGAVALSGRGTLMIREARGRANIAVSGFGRRTAQADGWLLFSDFDGTANITGDCVVSFSGEKVRLAASGDGDVYLEGRGVYALGQLRGEWAPAGRVVQLYEHD